MNLLRDDLRDITKEARTIASERGNLVASYGESAVHLAEAIEEELSDVAIEAAQRGEGSVQIVSHDDDSLIRRVKSVLQQRFPDLSFQIKTSFGVPELYVGWED